MLKLKWSLTSWDQRLWKLRFISATSWVSCLFKQRHFVLATSSNNCKMFLSLNVSTKRLQRLKHWLLQMSSSLYSDILRPDITRCLVKENHHHVKLRWSTHRRKDQDNFRGARIPLPNLGRNQILRSKRYPRSLSSWTKNQKWGPFVKRERNTPGLSERSWWDNDKHQRLHVSICK
jgi:hypothetical protein